MDTYALIVGVLAIIVGLAFAFFGYRLFMILLPLWGAIVGFFFGAHLAAVVFGTNFLGDLTSILVGVLVAILFAIGAWLWYWLAVAVLAGSIGYALTLGVLRYLDVSDRTLSLVLALVVAIAFAIIAIWLRLPRYVAILFTGIGGAFTAVAGAAVLVGRLPVRSFEAGSLGAYVGNELGLVWLLAAVILAAVGIGYQIWSTAQLEPVTYARYRNPWWRSPV